jgi:hypothetical protein
MRKLLSLLALAMLIAAPALAEGMYWRYRHHHRHYLARPRHVIEVVQPPYSGRFIINGAHFTGFTPACFSWAAGERITLVAGDWHGDCATAVFYNFRRHSTCHMWCR